MSQPNLSIVVGKRKKKNRYQPTTNPFWSQIPAMSNPLYPTRQIVAPQPVRWSLTEVPLTSTSKYPQPPSTPQNNPVIDLVDDNSPNRPNDTLNVSKNITMNTNKKSATNIGKVKKYYIMPTDTNMNDDKNSSTNTGNDSSTNTGNNPTMNTRNNPATNIAKNTAMNVVKNPVMNIAVAAGNSPALNTGNNPAMNTGNYPATSIGKNTAMNVVKNPAMNIAIAAGNNPVLNTANNPAMNIGNNSATNTAQNTAMTIIENPTMNVSKTPGVNPNVPTTGKRRGKKNKKQTMAAIKKIFVNPDATGVAKQAGETELELFFNPHKSNWLKAKLRKEQAKLRKQQENIQAVPQQEISTSPNAGPPPETPQMVEAPQNIDTPQSIEAPNTTHTAMPTSNSSQVSTTTATGQGFCIPTLDKAQTQNTKRTSAGSFFQKKKQQQKPWTSMFDAYSQYPKGVPRSFLTQQKQMSQDLGVQQTVTANLPIWPTQTAEHIAQAYQAHTVPAFSKVPPVNEPDATAAPIFVQTENQVDIQQPYSPSDIYAEYANNAEPCDDSELSEVNMTGQKRLSAFQRLGPLSQPKKPKLTINLMLNKEQPVREVVNDTEDDADRYTPVHLRQDIIMSTDETVMKYLTVWPWRKNVGVRRHATARHSRTVMILEQEQMEEAYDKDNLFIQITVKGYPSTWTKERVLDAILDSVKGYSLIPCFTEFYQHECKFLTLRSRSALIILHKTGFYIHKDGVELAITISQTDLTLNQIDFIPRIVLRKRVAMAYTEKKLNLSAFTLQDDISHFIYFPLSRLNNQTELIQIQSVIAWELLTSLDLSHNKLTNISGFDLRIVTPRLKHLDLSHNYLEKITLLINCRDLPLTSIHLEGNPLCNDYIDPEQYIKVLKMLFPAVVEIDGIQIHRKGALPPIKQNFCPADAQEVAEKFLEVYFPLLDSGPEDRSLIQGMYEDDATLTVTYCYKLRYGQIYRNFRNLFLYARFIEEGQTDSVMGAMAITKLINRWPHTEHDPFTFTLDVLQHTDTTTILRIGGVLKLTAETLAEDEHLLTFTRTVVLYTDDGAEYKIQNEMIYWDEPTAALARSAFRVNTISQKKLNLKIESATDEDLRAKFLTIFMKLTTMDKKISERCLELNNWNFKLALEHFTKLLKLNNLDSLTAEVNVTANE